MLRTALALAIGGLLLAGCFGDGSPPPAAPEASPTIKATSTATPSAEPSPAATATPTPSPMPTAQATRHPAATLKTLESTASLSATAGSGPHVTFGDGKYVAGVDIPPGRYRALSPSNDCTGRTIGDGDFVPKSTLTIVDIDMDDWLSSEGCGRWTDDLTPIVLPGQPFGDGSWLVGAEIAPGRYHAAAPSEECRWFRLAHFSGRFRVDSSGRGGVYLGAGRAWSGRGVVDIAAGDAGFHSEGCGIWSAASTRHAEPGQPFGDGLFLVDSELAPGLYRATAERCHWRLMSDFGGYFPSDRPDPSMRSGVTPVVDIRASAAGFHSEGCGTWSGNPQPIVRPGQPFGDGTFVVGLDIAPRRYRTTTATDECEWYRLHDFGGSVYDNWPGNLAGTSGAPLFVLSIVDAGPSGSGFVSNGCGEWSSDLAPIATPGQPFGDGTFLVGPEVAPERYRALSPAEDCQWARWGGFGGELEPPSYGWVDLIGYGDQILPLPTSRRQTSGSIRGAVASGRGNDAGPRSGCGEWTRLRP